MSERKERCETCKWWDEMYRDGKMGGVDPLDGTDEPWGLCRRYPPVIIERKDLYTLDAYANPITPEYHWCGEWQAKDAAGQE